jgi:monofunctional biosynthetic peptidoglycan transglycosylase
MRRIFLESWLLTLLAGALVYLYTALPDVSVLAKRNPKETALMDLRDRENKQKRLPASRQQIWISYDKISGHLKKAVLISEDASFFTHKGVDVRELKEALKKDFETMSLRRGGSTITMQLARNLYLSPAKNPLRKVKEIVIAWQLEHALSKTRIFELYLNVVELGRNIYGAEAASRHYFDKSAADVNALEAATLAALLPNPRAAHEKSVLNRRNLVLARLADVGHISREEYDRIKRIPLFRNVEQQSATPPEA